MHADLLCRDRVSIPFKRENTHEQHPISTQSGRGSKTPKPNANCTSLFVCQKFPQKARKPTCVLTQTRFFNKNGSEVRHPLFVAYIVVRFAVPVLYLIYSSCFTHRRYPFNNSSPSIKLFQSGISPSSRIFIIDCLHRSWALGINSDVSIRSSPFLI